MRRIILFAFALTLMQLIDCTVLPAGPFTVSKIREELATEEDDEVSYDDEDGGVGPVYDEVEAPKPIYKLEEAPKLFEKFIQDYNKKYKGEEDKKQHYETFVASLKRINENNSDKDISYTSDINLFSDLSVAEKAHLTGGVVE